MPKVKAVVRSSEPGDGVELAKNLRLADRREVIAHCGESPRVSVEKCVGESDKCWTVVYEDEPIAIFGYILDGESSANIWMLGSDKIEEIKWQFLRESKLWLKRITKNLDRVWAVADVRNKVHKDWFDWLGFSTLVTVNTGPFNLPFYHIEYIVEKQDV